MKNPQRYGHLDNKECSRIPNHHQPLIAKDVWDRVQKRLDQNRVGSKGGRTGYGTLPLSGLLICKGCDRHLRMQSRRPSKSEPTWYSYKCQYDDCPEPTGEFSTRGWVKKVLDLTMEHLNEPEFARILSETSRAAYEAGRDTGMLEAEIKERERLRRNLLHAIESGQIESDPDLYKRHQANNEALSSARIRLEQDQSTIDADLSPEAMLGRIRRLTTLLKRSGHLLNLDYDARPVLHELLEKIVVSPRPRTLEIHLKGEYLVEPLNLLDSPQCLPIACAASLRLPG